MTDKPVKVYMPCDQFIANVLKCSEGDERSKWVTSFALTLGGIGDEPFAKELITKSTEIMSKNIEKTARFREKQKQAAKQPENIPTPTAKVTTTQKATQPVQSPAPVENPWGSEQNVMITQAQFNELAQLCGNVNKAKQMVEDLSNKIASDPKFVSVNHFATLKYWASFQKQKETKAEQPRETFETRNMRAVERAIALIDDPTYKYPWETDEEQQARVCKKR